jgi:hypothetical protein
MKTLNYGQKVQSVYSPLICKKNLFKGTAQQSPKIKILTVLNKRKKLEDIVGQF